VHVPFFDTWQLGWLIIPLFVLVVFSTGVAVNMSDGLDGLAGGLSAIAFGAYAVVAIIEKKIRHCRFLYDSSRGAFKLHLV
jgi:phospho-N-acetylmuramoyl-pentapeptide-transferase